MYKVLIVDDEAWVVESLKDLLDWQHYGFEVVGQAANGSAALEAINTLHPDVVFTDIRMPEMNGLELIRRGKMLNNSPRFVVVSGYAEFAYAQKALTYGAFFYCLKPFDEIEIAGVLIKLKESLNSVWHIREETLQLLLDEPGGQRQEELLEILGEQGVLEWIKGGIVPVVALGRTELLLSEGRIIKLIVGTNKIAYLMRHHQVEAMEDRWRKHQEEAHIGIGRTIADWKEINNAIEEAVVAACQFFITGKPGIYSFSRVLDDELNDRLADIQSAISAKDKETILSTLNRIEQLFIEEGLSIRHAFQVYNMTISFLFNLGRKESILYSYEQMIRMFASLNEMMAELKSLTRQYMQQWSGQASESKNQAFNPILQFVTENYESDISLQDLARQFYMNPSYISQLFKKEVGETFTAYVAKLRILRACEFLEKSESSIQEIAERIGYRDYFYFTRIFKKQTGQTPTQYRAGKIPR